MKFSFDIEGLDCLICAMNLEQSLQKNLVKVKDISVSHIDCKLEIEILDNDNIQNYVLQVVACVHNFDSTLKVKYLAK